MIEILKRAWPYLVAVAVALLALYGAYSHGVSVTTSDYERKLAEQHDANTTALNDALAEQAKQSKANLDAALAIERQRLAQQAISQDFFNSLTEQVAQYVNQSPAVRACGLDADGLRIWREANRGSGAHAPAVGSP